MAIIPFMNVGAKGVNFDVPDVLLPNTQFSDCLNVRFKNGAVERAKGYTSTYSTTGAPTAVQYWNRPNNQYLIIGTGATVQRIDSAQNSSEIGSGFASDSVWNSTLYNGGYTSIWNNGQTTPHYITYRTEGESDGIELTPLPGWEYGGIRELIGDYTGSDGKTFRLTEAPGDDGVTVTVGDEEEAAANYSIDSDKLTFDDGQLPASGAPIIVTYTSDISLHSSTADGNTYDFELEFNPTYSISVYVDSVLQTSGFSITPTGAVRFVNPPANGAAISVIRTPNYVAQGSYTHQIDANFGLNSIAYVHSNTELTLSVTNFLRFNKGFTYTVSRTNGDTVDNWVFDGENIEVDADDPRIWKVSTFTTNNFVADVNVSEGDADLTEFTKYAGSYTTTTYQLSNPDDTDIAVFLNARLLNSSDFTLSDADDDSDRFVSIVETVSEGDTIDIVVDNGVVIGSFFGGSTNTDFVLDSLLENQAERLADNIEVFLDDSEITTGFTFGGSPLSTITFDTAPENGVRVQIFEQVEAAETVTAEVVAAFDEVLVAGNLTVDNGTTVLHQPGTVRVSTRAAVGSLPTTWEPGALGDTSTADEFEIADADPITAMKPLRGKLAIYTSRGLYLMTVGRDTTFVRSISSGYGAINQKCVVEVDGKHVFADRNDILVHAGTGEVKSILNHIARDYLFQERLNVDAIDNMFLVVHEQEYEVWICYPTGSNTSCDEALTWNYRDNTLGRRTIADARDGTIGPVYDGNEFTTTVNNLILASDSDEELYHADTGLDHNGTDFTAYVERSNINIGELEDEKWTGSVYPLVTSPSDNTMMTVYTLGTDVVTDMADITADFNTTSIEYNIDDEYKVDTRSQGRFMNIRFETTAAADWKLPGYSLSTVVSSSR